MGPVFSAGLFGLMIGALIFGTIADRIGRKRIIVLSTAAFGIGTLLTVLAQDAAWLVALRFLTGLGLGGAMPNAVALTSEFSPQRRRATIVMTMFAGFSIGAAVGGLLAPALIPAFGWRSVFMVGGLAPFMLVPILLGWRGAACRRPDAGEPGWTTVPVRGRRHPRACRRRVLPAGAPRIGERLRSTEMG
jgi:MFS transporter, AAHS family, 4-hydroxybenzoate transporter